MPTLRAAGRILSVAIMLALSGVFPPKNLKQVIFIHINKNLVKHEKEMWECLKACGVPALPCRIETYDVFANGYTNYEKLMPSLTKFSLHIPVTRESVGIILTT